VFSISHPGFVTSFDFCSENHVAAAKAVDGVGPDFNSTLAKANVKIGVMVLGFRYLCYLISEAHGIHKVSELEVPFKAAQRVDLPWVVQKFQQGQALLGV